MLVPMEPWYPMQKLHQPIQRVISLALERIYQPNRVTFHCMLMLIVAYRRISKFRLLIIAVHVRGLEGAIFRD